MTYIDCFYSCSVKYSYLSLNFLSEWLTIRLFLCSDHLIIFDTLSAWTKFFSSQQHSGPFVNSKKEWKRPNSKRRSHHYWCSWFITDYISFQIINIALTSGIPIQIGLFVLYKCIIQKEVAKENWKDNDKWFGIFIYQSELDYN